MPSYQELLADQRAESDRHGPLMLREMLALHGTIEGAGNADNPVILGWARELGLEREYDHDAIPWCGLSMAVVAKRANKTPPPQPLWALNWKSFGVPVPRPMLGDVLIKTRKGGGHVTLYAAETHTHYVCLGGNQSDSVCYSLIPKSSDQFEWAFRRPVYINQPANVRPVVLVSFDGTMTREA